MDDHQLPLGDSPKLNAGMFSSATDDWATPPDLFAYYNRIYGFELDVCASHENHKAPRYFTKEDNGLMQDWAPAKCWMNPPYGSTIGEWVRKAHEESRRGALVVCLLPARTDTGWWHNHCQQGRIDLLRGCLKFGKATTGAPFPSAVVTFMPADQWELMPYVA